MDYSMENKIQIDNNDNKNKIPEDIIKSIKLDINRNLTIKELYNILGNLLNNETNSLTEVSIKFYDYEKNIIENMTLDNINNILIIKVQHKSNQ